MMIAFVDKMRDDNYSLTVYRGMNRTLGNAVLDEMFPQIFARLSMLFILKEQLRENKRNE